MSSDSVITFGGPDKEQNALRNKLHTNIQAVPAGGKICWMCYYFNEPVLLEALIAATRRGVTVELVIEVNPRSPEINQVSLTILKQYPEIKVTSISSKPLWEYIGVKWHGHMHSKLYYFSHPTPCVLIGSYNPTTDATHINESSIEKIGDHTISHNALVKVEENNAINCLLNYFKNMQSANQQSWKRYSSFNNKPYTSDLWDINFLPRSKLHPVTKLLATKDHQATIKCAISHLKGPGVLNPLVNAKKMGKNVELILDSTQRRISNKHLNYLDKHQIKYHQLHTGKHVLMHNKFIIYKSEHEYCVLFGSFNWSMRSWYLNHEIIACNRSKEIISAFEQRWNELVSLA